MSGQFGNRDGVEEALRRIELFESSGPDRISLDLTGLGLHEVPQRILTLERLQELSLSRNDISDVPSGLSRLNRLRRLDLSRNRLTSIRSDALALPFLQHLNISHNAVSVLPEGLGALPCLSYLNTSANTLTSLPDSITALSALKQLIASRNALVILPEDIGQLKALRHLDLRQNQLAQLPPSLGDLELLETLIVAENQLSTIPPTIGRLKSLKQLNAASNHLTALPETIGGLPQLAHLNLYDNQLHDLPDSLFSLPLLQILQLTRNSLSTISPLIGNLTTLESVHVSDNQIREIPPELAQLTHLRSLGLSSNNISELPPQLTQLRELRTLQVCRNSLVTLPDGFGELESLRRLDLASNQLSSLDAIIPRLRRLIRLNAQFNKIESIPAQIGDLTALAKLSLANNRLTTIPQEIANLRSLAFLDVSDNQLESIPDVLGRMRCLHELYLHGNKLLGLPEELLGPRHEAPRTSRAVQRSPRDIVDYYRRIQGSEGQPLHECKIILVGRGGVGKTSLVRRLSRQPYNPKEFETHGINITRLAFSGAKGEVVARVWDFGGQVVLHSMHEFFLTERTLYILVLGERDDMLERDAIYWLQLIRSYAGNAPVIVVMNKSEGRRRTFDFRSLEESYGPILAWVATECSNEDVLKSGIGELRRQITAAIDSPHMDNVRRKFPVKWAKIKFALDLIPDSYLEYEDFRRLCEQHGEPDATLQDELAADLHDLGVAINYGRDPRLRDTTILRPDWLANGIYAILRANDEDDRLSTYLSGPLASNGVVTLDSLEAIYKKAEALGMLEAADYPEQKAAFLLRLMDAFQLSYPLGGRDGPRLVPTLLSLNPPEGLDEWADGNCTRMRYEFQVVPSPLIPWFIARTFSLVPDYLHWRRGAVLRFGDARAKVWATQDERYIYATVSGGLEDRESLTEMIRGTLDDIFNGYRGLRVVEQCMYLGNWVPRETLEQLGVLREFWRKGQPLVRSLMWRGE